MERTRYRGGGVWTCYSRQDDDLVANAVQQLLGRSDGTEDGLREASVGSVVLESNSGGFGRGSYAAYRCEGGMQLVMANGNPAMAGGLQWE